MGAGTNTDPSRCLPKTYPRSCNPAWIQALRLDLFTPGVGPTAEAVDLRAHCGARWSVMPPPSVITHEQTRAGESHTREESHAGGGGVAVLVTGT
jgi:hypothetical protein